MVDKQDYMIYEQKKNERKKESKKMGNVWRGLD